MSELQRNLKRLRDLGCRVVEKADLNRPSAITYDYSIRLPEGIHAATVVRAVVSSLVTQERWTDPRSLRVQGGTVGAVNMRLANIIRTLEKEVTP